MEQWSALLAWLEQSSLGHAIRGSSVWTYSVINLAHIVGIATLFGSVLILDLRLFGWPRRAEFASVAAIAVPLSIVGFCIAAASGVCMLATNGLEYRTNPFLPIKFAAILLALLNAACAARSTAWRNKSFGTAAERRQLAIFGAISLVSWFCAIGAGRMIGYW